MQTVNPTPVRQLAKVAEVRRENASAQRFDVRSPSEYAIPLLTGAHNVPLSGDERDGAADLRHLRG